MDANNLLFESYWVIFLVISFSDLNDWLIDCKACYEYRNADGKIKVSRRDDDGGLNVYHSYGDSTVAAAYPGDSAQMAFDRVIFSIDLQQIDWNKPLKKYIVSQLKEIKKEQ